MNQNLITVDELAEKLRVPKSWIYSQTRQTDPDSIPRIRCGKYIRFYENEVIAWLKRKQDDRNQV